MLALVTIVGNVSGTPEYREGTDGRTGTCFFFVAVNYKKDTKPLWFGVVLYGTLANRFSQMAGKGDRVLVSGKLFERPSEDGSLQLRIHGDSCRILDSKKARTDETAPKPETDDTGEIPF